MKKINIKYEILKLLKEKYYKINIINKLEWIFYNSNLFITKFIIIYFITM